MAQSSPLGSVYERAESFGRDVFQYMVTGTIFAIVGGVPWWSAILEEVRESSQIALLLAAATGVFGLGHGLVAIGFWIRNKIIGPDELSDETWWDGCWSWIFLAPCHVKLRNKYRCAREHTRRALPGSMAVGHELKKENAHLGMEMSVLLEQPRLHAVFIERYNTLWHLRLGLATSFLLAGVVNLGFAICSFGVTMIPGVPHVTGVVGVFSILLGRLLTCQHLVTNINFLERVAVAFKISEQRKA